MKNKRLNIKFDIKQLSEDGTIEGYGSIFGNRDRAKDIVERGAFAETLSQKQAKDIPMLWQHDTYEPIGVWEELKEDDRGLYCKGKLLDTSRGKDVYKMLKAGAISGLSIGYDTDKVTWEEEENGESTQILHRIDLWEVSVVTFPANREATITNVKAVSPRMNLPLADREREWDSVSARGRVRRFTDSEESPSTQYRRYFMYYDGENTENFGAYKLPFVDIIDGDPHIVPRAIFAIAGGRGVVGADIPEADKTKIKSKVNTLYARFRREFRDDTLISPFEDGKALIETWSLKEFDRFLKNPFSLSNSLLKTFRKRYLELHDKKSVEEESAENIEAETVSDDVTDVEENKATVDEKAENTNATEDAGDVDDKTEGTENSEKIEDSAETDNAEKTEDTEDATVNEGDVKTENTEEETKTEETLNEDVKEEEDDEEKNNSPAEKGEEEKHDTKQDKIPEELKSLFGALDNYCNYKINNN